MTLANNQMTYYTKCYFDISDTCNALCPWCERGSRNRKRRPSVNILGDRGNKFIPLDDFCKTIDYLLANKLIHPKETKIALYNWGEPLLHPQLYDIINSLRERDLPCLISTNGSIVLENKVPLDHLDYLCFSLSGFSQKSYDKAHGFSIKKVKNNIAKSIKNVTDAGCNPKNILLYAHAYKHNQDELIEIRVFASLLGVSFVSQDAYFNCREYLSQYLQGELPADILADAQQDLFLKSAEEITKTIHANGPEESCPQLNYLTLSHRGRLSICCATDLVSPAYELFDFKDKVNITREEINNIRMNSDFCKKCKQLGLNRVI